MEPPCIKFVEIIPGTSIFAEFVRMPCSYTEQGEIIVNKISTTSQHTRDLQVSQLKVLKEMTKLNFKSEFLTALQFHAR